MWTTTQITQPRFRFSYTYDNGTQGASPAYFHFSGYGPCGATICNHAECVRESRRRAAQIVPPAKPERVVDRIGRVALSSSDLGIPLKAPATRAPVPRAHDKRMGFADAPRRPCYRAPRRQP